MKDYVDHNQNTLLPELEDKKQTASNDLESIRSEKEKLSRWLLGANFTSQAVSFLNQQVDRLGEE
jgi:hypothetical protein